VAAAALAGAIVLVLCVVLNLPSHVRGLSREHPLFHADLVLAILAAITVGLAVLSLLRSRETQRQTSARGEAESALIESERRYRDLVDLSPDAILVHADGRFVFANEAAARYTGTACCASRTVSSSSSSWPSRRPASSPARVSISTTARLSTEFTNVTPPGLHSRAVALTARDSGQRPSWKSESAALPRRKLP
jgi:PAS domain-containing protein